MSWPSLCDDTGIIAIDVAVSANTVGIIADEVAVSKEYHTIIAE